MTAGLPGLGLGGLFFILSALLAPVVELWRIARGRSRRGVWPAIWRQFAIAVAMIVAIELTLRGVFGLVSLAGFGNGAAGGSISAVPVVAIGITSGLLALVLVGAKVADLAFRLRPAPLGALVPARLPSRSFVLGAGAALCAAWFLLLLVGASDLSPVISRHRAPGPSAGTLGSSAGGGDGKASAAAAPGSEAGPANATPTTPVSSAGPGGDQGAPSGGGSAPPDGPVAEAGPHPGSGGTAPPPTPTQVSTGAGAGGGGGGTTQGGSGAPAAPTSTGPPASAGANGHGPPAAAGTGSANGGTASQGPPPSAGPPPQAGPPTTSNAPPAAGPPETAGPPAHAGPKDKG